MGDDKNTKSEPLEDIQIARRMFLKKTTLAAPLVVAAFSISRPVYAATCTPQLEGPCTPPDACQPTEIPCSPSTGCNPKSK